MNKFLRNLAEEMESVYHNPTWIFASCSGVIGILAMYTFNHFATIYANSFGGPSLSDVLLDRLPIVNTIPIHIHAIQILFLVLPFLLFVFPRRIPIALIGIASIIAVRALCIGMTHMGAYAGAPRVSTYYMLPDSLFFSGHVAFPTFLAFVFWDVPKIRIPFLVVAVCMGVESLLGHVHYSIDIFSAPFFAYGIYACIRSAAPSIRPEAFSPSTTPSTQIV